MKYEGIKDCTLDIDATCINAYKQKTKMAYESSKGYMPMVGHLEENGLLVPPANPESLAEAILWMVNNRDKAKRLAEEGFRRVHEQFSATAMVRNNLDVYEKVLVLRR